MQWLLDSIEKAPSFAMFQQKIIDAQDNIEKNPVLTIELCKTIIEGICKTILNDIGNSIPDKFTNLITDTINAVNSEHPDADHIKALFQRMNGVLHYIGEIRNEVGCYASHGQDICHKKPSSDLALFVLNVTNTIMGFILHLYVQLPHKSSKRIHYENYAEFNDYLDDLYTDSIVTNMKIQISYSKALFEQDSDAYWESYLDYVSSEQKRLLES